MSQSPTEQIDEYVRTHPDADPVKVLGTLGLSPEYRATVEDALAGENPPTEPDSLQSNPGGNVDASGSTPPESGTVLDADFATTAPDTYPPARADTEQWMVRGEALPPHGREKAPAAHPTP